MSTTAPDGAIAVGRREIYNGVPGRWRFDLDGTVYPGERAPALTLLDLPANWDA